MGNIYKIKNRINRKVYCANEKETQTRVKVGCWSLMPCKDYFFNRPYVNMLIFRYYLKKFTHNVLGWHDGDFAYKIEFDGATTHSTCSFCGKDVMQDSQGGWF